MLAERIGTWYLANSNKKPNYVPKILINAKGINIFIWNFKMTFMSQFSYGNGFCSYIVTDHCLQCCKDADITFRQRDMNTIIKYCVN